MADLRNIEHLELPDSHGQPQRLGALWALQPTIVVWLRHYGWTFCREHVAQLRERWEDITGTGATVVAIGMGQVEMAAHFREEQNIPFPLIVDRKKETYRALEVTRGSLLDVVGPSVWLQGLKNVTKGHAPFKRPQQDALQLGATAIVKPGGEIAHLHRAKDSSDNYPIDEAVKKVSAL